MNPSRVDIPSLTSALEWVADAVEVSVQPSGKLVYVNPAWCTLTGYSTDEAIGHTPRELLRAASWRPPAWYDGVDERLARGEPFHGTIVSRRKDGSEMVNMLHVTPTLSETGELRHFIVVRHDLTLEHEAARLRIKEARLERAVRGANDGLWEYACAEGLVHLSERCVELCGARSPALTTEEALALVHPEDRGRVAERAREGGQGNDDLNEEFRLLVDGAPRWVQLRARVYRGESGAPSHVAGALTDIQAIKDAQAAALDAAARDTITELPNRGAFVARVEQAVRRAARVEGPAFALLFIDLRKFKQVNDRLGHAAGDDLLRAVAERLRAIVRPGDVVARLGGDEFGVLLEPMVHEEHVLATARRVERGLARDFHLGARVLQIAGTVGAVMGDGRSDVDTLIRDADAAMYAARADGRRGHGLADPVLRAQVQRRAILERDVLSALRRREITVALQPIVGTLDRRPMGAEALVRWRHPELGPVPPLELLACTDDLDLGAELGLLVLEKSVDWVAAARREGLLSDQFVLHVNANARQMANPRFADNLRLVARGSGLPAGGLFVEITETVLVDRPDEMTELMHELIGAGLGFSLDDFGTGWSSLAHLRRFPVHGLKIDRSFTLAVRNEPKTGEIVRGLVTMARALDIVLVAEGVETEAEAHAMAELGCDHAQGYLYAPPLSPEDALAALRVWRSPG